MSSVNWQFELQDREELDPIGQKYFDKYLQVLKADDPLYQFRTSDGVDQPHELSMRMLHCFVCKHYNFANRCNDKCPYRYHWSELLK